MGHERRMTMSRHGTGRHHVGPDDLKNRPVDECIARDNLFVGRTMTRSIGWLVGEALRLSLRNPSQVLFLLRTLYWQRRAARRRQAWEGRGLHVPPLLIWSVTGRCNLQCKGCYAWAQNRPAEAELDTARMRSVLSEARDLGVSIVLMAGGEPFIRPDLLDVTAAFPEILFPTFTNGTLFDEAVISRLRRQKNLIPILSLEGDEAETDDRRGPGTYQRLVDLMRRLRSSGVFFGTSTTMTRNNVDRVTGEPFVAELLAVGCRLFFLIQYIPVVVGTESWELTAEQRAAVPDRVARLQAGLPALFLSFPGGEDEVAGCLASGRGFVHISPQGRVEPCPFAPYSDTDLQEASLADAFRSPFLHAIRENRDWLLEGRGGCALWENRSRVEELLQDVVSETTSRDGLRAAPRGPED